MYFKLVYLYVTIDANIEFKVRPIRTSRCHRLTNETSSLTFYGKTYGFYYYFLLNQFKCTP